MERYTEVTVRFCTMEGTAKQKCRRQFFLLCMSQAVPPSVIQSLPELAATALLYSV